MFFYYTFEVLSHYWKSQRTSRTQEEAVEAISQTNLFQNLGNGRFINFNKLLQVISDVILDVVVLFLCTYLKLVEVIVELLKSLHEGHKARS